jgi:hypothetical protein
LGTAAAARLTASGHPTAWCTAVRFYYQSKCCVFFAFITPSGAAAHQAGHCTAACC